MSVQHVPRSRFSFRTFTSFMLAWTFLVLVLSGVVLYVSPPGRIANWSVWRLGALTKSQWQAVHMLTAIVFLLGGLFHLLKFNWRAFYNYATKRSEGGLRYGKEAAFSLVFFGAVLAGTLFGLQPFSFVTTAGEKVKNSWSAPSNEPPVPHMEMLTLTQVAGRLQLSEEAVLARLKESGWTAQASGQTLAEVARQNGRSPQETYTLLQRPATAHAADPAHPGTGMGLGIKTVGEISIELGLDRDRALAFLREHRIEALSEDTIRTVASNAGMRPFEVVELLKQAAK
jgi:hypothetical protein